MIIVKLNVKGVFCLFPKRYWYVLLTYFAFSLLFGGLAVQLFLVKVFNVDLFYGAIIGNIFSFSVGLIIILILMKPDFRLEKETSDTTVPQIIGWSILGFIMAFVAQGIAANIEVYVFKIEAGSENTQDIVKLMKQAPLFFVVPALVGPILEELVFRKVIYGSLAKKFNVYFAAIVSAAIFAVAHMELTHFLVYFSIGLVFTFLYAKTKRIIVPIIAHMSMNGFVLIIQSVVDIEEMQKILDEINEGFILIFFGG